MTMPLATSDIYDAHPTEVDVCDAQFRSFGRIRTFSGPCATVRTFEDPDLIRAAFEEPGRGRVLVIDAGGSLRCAVIGDKMAGLALRSGWAGVVLYGAVRDSDALDRLDFGIKALGTIARRAPGAIGGVRDVAVTLAGATFRPGHHVYADADAVLVARENGHKPWTTDA